MKRWLLTLTATAFAFPAFGAPPYVGVWAESQKFCIGEGDRVPIEIRENEIVFYESRCNLKSIVQNSNTWTAKKECSGEGETWIDDIRMTVSGDNLTLAVDNQKSKRYVRCKK